MKAPHRMVLQAQLNALIPEIWIFLGPIDIEFKFYPARKWRFDFCLRKHMIALEIEGVNPKGDRHRSIGGFQKDREKYLRAFALGWTVLQATPRQLERGEVVGAILERLGLPLPPLLAAARAIPGTGGVKP